MSTETPITEQDISLAVLQIAATKTDGVASFEELRRQIPDYVPLGRGDRVTSMTRANEEIWEQRARNIVSHKATPGNIIADGLAESVPRVGIKITQDGLAYLKHLCLI